MTRPSRRTRALPPIPGTVGIFGRCLCANATPLRDGHPRLPAVSARRGRTREDAEPAAYESLHGR